MKDTGLPLVVDDADVAVLCGDVTVYWRGSAFDRVEGLLHFYDTALAGIREHVRYYETETMGELRPIRRDTLELLSHWLRNPKAKRGIMALLLESATKVDASSDRALSVFCDEDEPPHMGFIRLVMPAALMAASPAAFVDTVKHMVSKLDFESGHAGFSINWEPRGQHSDDVEVFLRRLAKKHPGVDIPEPNTTLIAMQDYGAPSLKCVNWLTLLGAELSAALAAEFGNVQVIQQALPAPCRVEPLPTGLLFTAGEAPLLGDRSKPEALLPYHAVGRLLSGLRVPEHAPLFLDDEEASDDWLRRFDV